MNSRVESTDRLEQIASRAVAALNRVTRNRPSLPFATLLASLTILFVVRYCVVAQHIDMGSDIANYLSTTNTLFGHDVLAMGLLRPPLISVILKPFTLIFGDLAGVKVLGALISVAMGIPFYLLARRTCRPWIAVAMSLVFVLMPAYSDMLAWGYLTMFGMFFIMLAIHFLLRVLEQPSKLNVFFTSLSVSFVAGFHQLSLAFFVPLSLLLFVALLVFNRPNLIRHYKPLMAAVAIAVILSIPYVPIYLRLLRLQAQAVSDAPLISLTPMTQVRAGFEFNVNPSWAPWLLGIVFLVPLTAATLRSNWRKDRTTLIVLLVAFLYSLGLILFVFPPPFLELNRRAHHFMYIPLWLLVGLSLSHLWSWQTICHRSVPHWLPKLLAVVLVLALLSSTILPSWRALARGLDYYGYLDNDRWDAVKWIRDNTPEESSVVAYPETLGWWIEAEAVRRTANVADRDTVPLDYYRERSLAADRILSRNQGVENGNLRLATTYPYRGAPGNPAVGVYLGGSYRDALMFDESSTVLTTETDHWVALSSATLDDSIASGDEDSRTMTTSYHIGDAVVTQTARLDRGARGATICYQIRSGASPATGIDIPVLLALEPESVTIAPGGRSIEVLQTFSDLPQSVQTQINIDTAGCSVDTATYHTGQLDLSFGLQGSEATITFGFLLMEPTADRDEDVTHYQTAQVISDYSINYVAIDLTPNPNLASQVPLGLEEWLNRCPYYELVYPLDGPSDIRIYRVDAPASP
jgi:hypothetical protein